MTAGADFDEFVAARSSRLLVVEGAANVHVWLEGAGDDAEAGIAIYTATDAAEVYRPE